MFGGPERIGGVQGGMQIAILPIYTNNTYYEGFIIFPWYLAILIQKYPFLIQNRMFWHIIKHNIWDVWAVLDTRYSGLGWNVAQFGVFVKY